MYMVRVFFNIVGWPILDIYFFSSVCNTMLLVTVYICDTYISIHWIDTVLANHWITQYKPVWGNNILYSLYNIMISVNNTLYNVDHITLMPFWRQWGKILYEFNTFDENVLCVVICLYTLIRGCKMYCFNTYFGNEGSITSLLITTSWWGWLGH